MKLRNVLLALLLAVPAVAAERPPDPIARKAILARVEPAVFAVPPALEAPIVFSQGTLGIPRVIAWAGLTGTSGLTWGSTATVADGTQASITYSNNGTSLRLNAPNGGRVTFAFNLTTSLTIADDGTDSEIIIPNASTLDITDGTNNLVQIVDNGTSGYINTSTIRINGSAGQIALLTGTTLSIADPSGNTMGLFTDAGTTGYLTVTQAVLGDAAVNSGGSLYGNSDSNDLMLLSANDDGASAVGVTIGAYDDYTTAGAKIAIFADNCGTACSEKLAVSYTGVLLSTGGGSPASNVNGIGADSNEWRINHSSATGDLGFGSGGVQQFRISGSATGGGIAVMGVTAAKTTDYVALVSDFLIPVDVATTGDVAITLPAASAAKGQILQIKATALHATRDININRAGSDTIVTVTGTAQTTLQLSPVSTYVSTTLISDGTSVWYVTECVGCSGSGSSFDTWTIATAGGNGTVQDTSANTFLTIVDAGTTGRLGLNGATTYLVDALDAETTTAAPADLGIVLRSSQGTPRIGGLVFGGSNHMGVGTTSNHIFDVFANNTAYLTINPATPDVSIPSSTFTVNGGNLTIGSPYGLIVTNGSVTAGTYVSGATDLRSPIVRPIGTTGADTVIIYDGQSNDIIGFNETSSKSQLDFKQATAEFYFDGSGPMMTWTVSSITIPNGVLVSGGTAAFTWDGSIHADGGALINGLNIVNGTYGYGSGNSIDYLVADCFGIDFASITLTTEDSTQTLLGASPNDGCMVSSQSNPTGSSYTCFSPGAGQVTIRHTCVNGAAGTCDPASTTVCVQMIGNF